MADASEIESIRLVLPADVEEADIMRFAKEAGLQLRRRDERDDSKRMPLSIVFDDLHREAALSWTFNHIFQVSYVRCFGRDRADLAERVDADFQAVTLEEIREHAAHEDPDSRMLAIAYLAVYLTKKFDPTVIDLFERAARDPAPIVRQACYLAIGHLGWKELLPLLHEMEANETDPELKEEYRNFSRELESAGSG